ncbi:MAG TPA: hypothetical protein VGR07_21660, partial [Thermoanaerobaculia bacterium]|nr:hypothetical protein [Thermoanaerobaculia bacterium]
AVIADVVRLGEGYSIVSEYTSFLVLENDAEYKRWQIERKNATRVERDRRSQATVAAALERLRAKAAEGIGPVDPAETRPAPAAPLAAERLTGAPAPAPGPARPRGNSHDVDFGGSGGGGALDPVTAGLALTLAGLGLARRYRQQGKQARHDRPRR